MIGFHDGFQEMLLHSNFRIITPTSFAIILCIRFGVVAVKNSSRKNFSSKEYELLVA